MILLLLTILTLILVGIGKMEEYKAENPQIFNRREEADRNPDEEDSEPEDSEEDKKGPAYAYLANDVTAENASEEGQDLNSPYYSGPYNALRDDLSYNVTFTDAIYYSEKKNNVFVEVEYPQVDFGGGEKEEYINTALHYEFDYYKKFFEEDLKAEMKDEDYYYCIVDSDVTYMDEKILSVVFTEELQVKAGMDTLNLINYYCLNFDLETGTLLENETLLDVDEAFAADFRRREIEENGEGALVDYTDIQLMRMLQNDDYLVLFYTPMGMEIGLNLTDIVVYMMYEDYEQFLK